MLNDLSVLRPQTITSQPDRRHTTWIMYSAGKEEHNCFNREPFQFDQGKLCMHRAMSMQAAGEGQH